MNRFWLDQLPSSDPAFTPLQRAEEMSPEDWGPLAFWHRQAVTEAAWGAELDVLEERAEAKRAFAARQAERAGDEAAKDPYVHGAEIEALGYALGVTAVRVAIRMHDAAQDRFEVAS